MGSFGGLCEGGIAGWVWSVPGEACDSTLLYPGQGFAGLAP